MNSWKPVSDPPEQDRLLVVAAWEFGCNRMVFFAKMCQSSLPDQPMQFYLAPELYPLDRPRLIAQKVRYWKYVLEEELPDE